MKFKEITKRNFPPIDWGNRKSQRNLSVPAYADDVNKVGGDVGQIYSNFRTDSFGGFTAATGATAAVSVIDSDVTTDTKVIGITIHNVSASSGYPFVAGISKDDAGSFMMTIGNAVADTPLDVSSFDVDYLIDKELS